MDKQEENMSNTNDTIESKQKSEMTKKVRSGKKTGVQKKIIIIGILVSLLVIIYLIEIGRASCRERVLQTV